MSINNMLGIVASSVELKFWTEMFGKPSVEEFMDKSSRL